MDNLEVIAGRDTERNKKINKNMLELGIDPNTSCDNNRNSEYIINENIAREYILRGRLVPDGIADYLTSENMDKISKYKEVGLI